MVEVVLLSTGTFFTEVFSLPSGKVSVVVMIFISPLMTVDVRFPVLTLLLVVVGVLLFFIVVIGELVVFIIGELVFIMLGALKSSPKALRKTS